MLLMLMVAVKGFNRQWGLPSSLSVYICSVPSTINVKFVLKVMEVEFCLKISVWRRGAGGGRSTEKKEYVWMGSRYLPKNIYKEQITFVLQDISRGSGAYSISIHEKQRRSKFQATVPLITTLEKT